MPAPRAPSWTASSSGTNSGWTSPSRPCVWRDNESVCRTVNYCTTPGCCVSKSPCHRTCRRSNNGNKRRPSPPSLQDSVARRSRVARRFDRSFSSTPWSRCRCTASQSRSMRKVSSERRAATEDNRGRRTARPTMDIDMLRKGKADQATLLALVKDCATLDVEADGLTFLADSRRIAFSGMLSGRDRRSPPRRYARRGRRRS